jgi:hypothetical protein
MGLGSLETSIHNMAFWKAEAAVIINILEIKIYQKLMPQTGNKRDKFCKVWQCLGTLVTVK